MTLLDKRNFVRLLTKVESGIGIYIMDGQDLKLLDSFWIDLQGNRI